MKKPMTARRTHASREAGVARPAPRRSSRASLTIRRACAPLMVFLLMATVLGTSWSGVHPAGASVRPMVAGNTVDGQWRWEQAINQPIELGNETTAGTPVTFANLFTGTQGGYPYFPASIAGSANSCSVTPTGVDLFVEASGAGSPCGGTSDSGSGGNGKGDFYIGVAYVVIPPSVASAVFRVGSAGRNNELHVMFGAPGSAVRVAGGYSAGSTFSHTADLGSLPPAYGGSRVAELRVYTHDAAAASGASAEWNLNSGGFMAIPSTNVSTPSGFVNGLVCDLSGAVTLSQGGWGNRSTSNPLTSVWFGARFAGGLKIGGGTNSVTFTTASAMRNFLPQSGTSAVLTGGNRTDLSRSLKNTLAGQTAALTLNLALSPSLSDTTFVGDFNGYTGTLRELLSSANAALNGTGSPTKADLASINRNVDYANLAFERGVDAGRLQCGASPVCYTRAGESPPLLVTVPPTAGSPTGSYRFYWGSSGSDPCTGSYFTWPVVWYPTACPAGYEYGSAGNFTGYTPDIDVNWRFCVPIPAAEITVTSTAPVDPQVGATYTPTATSTSGQTVVITIDPSSSSVCTISSGVVTFNAVGTCTVNFNDPGNASYSAATQQQQTMTVVAAPSCSELPSLATAGSPTISGSDPFTVSNGVWVTHAGCTNTFTYQWQYTRVGMPPIPENQWTNYAAAGFTSNVATYDDLMDSPGGCVTYARALVTADNGFGTTTVPATPLIELCS